MRECRNCTSDPDWKWDRRTSVDCSKQVNGLSIRPNLNLSVHLINSLLMSLNQSDWVIHLSFLPSYYSLVFLLMVQMVQMVQMEQMELIKYSQTYFPTDNSLYKTIWIICTTHTFELPHKVRLPFLNPMPIRVVCLSGLSLRGR